MTNDTRIDHGKEWPPTLWQRAIGKYMRVSSKIAYKRPLQFTSSVPIISFTFDDFPRSALLVGGDILKRAGAAGTYYASMGLMARRAPVGEIFEAGDVPRALEAGHELGCHTFAHCDSWHTDTRTFVRSTKENLKAFREIVPDGSFETFSYPINPPRMRTKRDTGRNFAGCRGGGQTFNVGTADLGLLSAFFLEKSRDDIGAIRRVIDANRQACGWLIFATHDVDEHPSPFGCRPRFFEDVVEYAQASGARILTVAQALREIVAECQTVRTRARK
jgi:peptidoglycan/xylan/chitin deacetylase (PgdA/CDA1 family)